MFTGRSPNKSLLQVRSDRNERHQDFPLASFPTRPLASPQRPSHLPTELLYARVEMKRRTFIQTGIAASATAAAQVPSMPPPKKAKITSSVMLWTLKGS